MKKEEMIKNIYVAINWSKENSKESLETIKGHIDIAAVKYSDDKIVFTKRLMRLTKDELKNLMNEIKDTLYYYMSKVDREQSESKKEAQETREVENVKESVEVEKENMCKKYKVVFQRESNGSVGSDIFSEPNEKKARRSFSECYRHDNYKILSVTEIQEEENVKEEEQKSIEKETNAVEENKNKLYNGKHCTVENVLDMLIEFASGLSIECGDMTEVEASHLIKIAAQDYEGCKDDIEAIAEMLNTRGKNGWFYPEANCQTVYNIINESPWESWYYQLGHNLKRYGERYILTPELLNVIGSYMYYEIREDLNGLDGPQDCEEYLRKYLELCNEQDREDFEEILYNEFNIEIL